MPSNRPKPVFVLLGLCAFSACAPAGGEGPFGPLPASPLARWEYDGARAEIAFESFVDPRLLEGRIPAGIRPLTLTDLARDDTSAARILTERPEAAGYLLSAVVFTAIDEVRLNGRRLGRPGAPLVSAFWWVWIDRATADTLDPRARSSYAVELNSWYDDAAVVAQVRQAGALAESGRLVMVQRDSTDWSISFGLPDLQVRATCRLHGPERTARYALPAYSTVWDAGSRAQAFTVYTYHGHRSRRCAATWTAEGDHPLARSMVVVPAGTTAAPRARSEYGWHARAGVYRRP